MWKFGICVALVSGTATEGEMRLERALAEKARVLAMTNAELAATPSKVGTGLFRPFVNTAVFALTNAGQFWGVSEIDKHELETAWMESSINSTDELDRRSERCLHTLSVFWLSRPDWFVPSRDDLLEARTCLDLTLDKAFGIEPENRHVITTLAVQLIPVLYSAETELFLRKPWIIPTYVVGKWKSFRSFQTFMTESVVISSLLDQATRALGPEHIDKWLAFADEYMGGGVHLGDLVDSVWSQHALNGDGALTLPLWRLLALESPGFDRSELIFEGSKKLESGGFSWSYLVKVMLNRRGEGRAAWESVVGRLLDSLEPRERVLSCSENSAEIDEKISFDQVSLDPMAAMRMYRCIVVSVERGSVRLLNDDRRAENVATLMHLVRMSFGALAFLLDTETQLK